MKTVCLILFMGLNISAWPQNVLFRLRIYTACDSVPKEDPFLGYYLVSIENKRAYYLNGVGVELPGKGSYELHISGDEDLEKKLLNISSAGVFIYNYQLPNIFRKSLGDAGYKYITCDRSIEGYAEDRYSNGKLRVKGNFAKGIINDSLVTFYENGKTKKRLIRSSEEVVIEHYNRYGHLVKVDRNKPTRFLTDFVSKEFYPSGKIKRVEIQNAKENIIKEYQPSGVLKTNQDSNFRVEYFENGKKRAEWLWLRSEGSSFEGTQFDFRISRKVFDAKGKLVESIDYELWDSYRGWPDLTKNWSKCNWINNWTQYKKGKALVRALDQDPDLMDFSQ